MPVARGGVVGYYDGFCRFGLICFLVGLGEGSEIMKTRKYKTLRGFFRAVDGQITLEKFFTGRAYFRGRGWRSFELPEFVRQEVAHGFASWLYATKGARRAEVAEGLVNGRGDLSLFQCFDLELHPQKGLIFGTSLSGPDYEFCKRKYLKQRK